MDIDFRYKTFVESIKMLSLSKKKQQHQFPSFVDTEIELISTFEDAFVLIPELIENNLLGNETIANVIRCYILMKISMDNETGNSISENDWGKIRSLAREILSDIEKNI